MLSKATDTHEPLQPVRRGQETPSTGASPRVRGGGRGCETRGQARRRLLQPGCLEIGEGLTSTHGQSQNSHGDVRDSIEHIVSITVLTMGTARWVLDLLGAF